MHCISVSCFGLIARIVYFQTREVRPTVIECLLPDWKRQRLISMQQCRVFLQDGDRRGHSLCRTTNERQVSCGWRQQHAGDDANDASQSPKWRGFGHCQGRHARRSCIETLACDPADTVTLSSRSLDIARCATLESSKHTCCPPIHVKKINHESCEPAQHHRKSIRGGLQKALYVDITRC
jgi:hypothetical protein